MVLTEFDEKKYLAMMRKEEWEDGHAAGLLEGHASGLLEGHASGLSEGEAKGEKKGRLTLFTSMLSDLGQVPNEIVEKAKTLDLNTLKAWTRMASRAGSMEEFLDNI